MVVPRQSLTTDRSLADYGKELVSLTDPKGKRFQRVMARDVVPVVQRYADRRIVAVFKPPPPRTYPGSPRFIWSRDKIKQARARRWFWANYPNGYKRTGRMEKQNQLDVYFKNAQLALSLSNTAPGASRVYGVAEYGFEQVPGHKTTGWQNYGEEGADLILEVGEFANGTLSDALEEEGKRL